MSLLLNRSLMMGGGAKYINVLWNQRVGNGNFESNTGWDRIGGQYSVENNTAKLNLTRISQYFNVPKYLNHVHYCYCEIMLTEESDANVVYYNCGWEKFYTTKTNEWDTIKGLATFIKSGGGSPFVGFYGLTATNSVYVRNVKAFDLTEMYGAGNEPTLDEFERQCKLNNVDLSVWQERIAETPMRWRIK